jgi:hypothetical protein
MPKLQCLNCGNGFKPLPQVPNQSYCSKTNCQKERRRHWQKNKLQSDPDYRENQSRAQKAWTKKNPDYWRSYRQGKPDYADPRKSKRESASIEPRNTSVKMDSNTVKKILRNTLNDGVFRLKVLAEPDGVKMDVWIVELSSVDKSSS